MQYSWFAFLFLVLLNACTGSTPAPSLTRSAQVLTTTPDAFVQGSFQDGDAAPVFLYLASSEDGQVLFEAIDDGAQTCIDTESNAILWGDSWRVADTTWFVVSVVMADETARVLRYKDVDGDGAPDESSKEEIATSGTEPAYITSVTRVDNEDASAVFVLDSRCQDIWVASDTDSDGWADELETTAFAMSADYSEILKAAGIVAFDHDGIDHAMVITSGIVRGSSRVEGYMLYDDDGDGSADRVESSTQPSPTPSSYGRLYHGQSTVTVLGGYSADGRIVEAWELGEQGEDVVLLSSATFAASNVLTMSLTRSLAQGEQIGLRFADGGIQFIQTVAAAEPQVLGTGVSRYTTTDLEVPQTITLTGLNFVSTMIVTVLGPDGTLSTAAPTVLTSTEATITLPTYVEPTEGFPRASLAIWASSSQNNDDPTIPVMIAVSPPAE